MMDKWNKILGIFVLNRNLQKDNKNELIKTLVKYVAIWIGACVLTSICRKIPLVKNLLFNLKTILGWYTLAGIALAVLQYLGKCVVKEDVEYYSLNDVKDFFKTHQTKQHRIIMIVTIVILCLIPRGAYAKDKKYVEKNVVMTTDTAVEMDKVVEKEDISKYVDAQKEKANENEESLMSEYLAKKETEQEIEEDTQKYIEELKEFYSFARGSWKNNEVCYTFIQKGDKYLFFDSNSVGDHMTNENYYVADYRVKAYENSNNMITTTLEDVDGIIFDVELTHDGSKGTQMRIRRKNDNDWIELENNNCYSIEDFLAKEEYKAYIIDEYDWVKEVSYKQKSSELCFVDCFDYFEGQELILQDGFCMIWGMDNGIVIPITALGGWSSKVAKYDAENGVLWEFMFGAYGNEGTYTKRSYNPEDGSWDSVSVGESELDTSNMSSLVFCEIGEDYEKIYQEQMQAQMEEKLIANFAVDDSMVITTPIEEYEGVYYKEFGQIYISGVSEKVMTVNHTEDSSYTIFGILARQTEGFPEGTAVYAGSVSAEGRYGHSGSFQGDVTVVLLPSGEVFVKCLGGDALYQDGFFSKEEGKY